MNSIFSFMLLLLTYANRAEGITSEECVEINSLEELNISALSKAAIPELSRYKKKGAAGGIIVIGGSELHSGAPYFAAISALKVGADLVHIITTESAAPVIKTYSPDIIVLPFRNNPSSFKINDLIKIMNVVVLGPGLGREPEDIQLVYEVIEFCKTIKKPLVIDADGLYAIAKNVSILKDYPSPGAILTPNHSEVRRLKNAIQTDNWFDYWGDYVSVLEKGQDDEFHSSLGNISWKFSNIGSGRRVGGQGDILAGALGTFFHWALESNLCKNDYSAKVTQLIATYSAAKLTRTCNFKAYSKLGRSMASSDMINEIHSSFTELFEQ